MAWNYRKRIKLAPGIHLNLSKGGVSTSIGRKGVSVSMGKNGAYLNTSIPAIIDFLGLGENRNYNIEILSNR